MSCFTSWWGHDRGKAGLHEPLPDAAAGWSDRAGSVTFENLRWFNAAPTCLAPLLGLPVVWLIAKARVAEAWSFEQWDLLIWAGLSAQLLSCWPSSTDLVQSLRSWPLYLAGVSLAMMHYL
ncbi:hypothetical protein [Cupriavidus sp. EM10]|uniref:hypothetical protein n=1 Tax=Cupriavidus sp. EM10 TaxID=2839983 RepID=UPI001CEC1C1F|nr:hypothetical protein [Cupriavidus sp. EM10]